METREFLAKKKTMEGFYLSKQLLWISDTNNLGECFDCTPSEVTMSGRLRECPLSGSLGRHGSELPPTGATLNMVELFYVLLKALSVSCLLSKKARGESFRKDKQVKCKKCQQWRRYIRPRTTEQCFSDHLLALRRPNTQDTNSVTSSWHKRRGRNEVMKMP